MSGEIVVAAPFATLAAAAAAFPPLAVAVLLGSGAAALGSGAARALREAREREESERARELAELGRRLDELVRSRARETPAMSENLAAENRDFIARALREIELAASDPAHNDPISTDPAPVDPAPDPDADARELFAALALLDADAGALKDEYERAAPFRRRVIYENARFAYGDAVRRRADALWRASKIKDMRASLADNEAREFDAALAALGYPAREPDETAFASLLQEYAALFARSFRRAQAALIEERLKIRLKNMGYEPISREGPAGAIYFHTTDTAYRVMARVDPASGALSLRLVRVVASEADARATTTEQRRRDREMERKWCEKSRALLRDLGEIVGGDFEELYRREGGEVLAVVDESLARGAARAEERASD